MSYENTEVAVSKSQDAIRKLIFAHKGSGVMLVSRPPHEGFEAFIEIEKMPYHVRIMAVCKDQKKDSRGYLRKNSAYASAVDQELRRVWRVLYWHLKAIFEAADSGVIDIRNVILPYVVLRDGSTVADCIVPHMQDLMTMNPKRLLASGEAEQE